MNEARHIVVAIHERISKNAIGVKIYSLVAEHGVEFQGRRKPSTYPYGREKECFSNAYRLVEEEHDLLDVPYGEEEGCPLTYVEGYVVTEIGMPIHHAWVVTENGQVIDPTLRYHGRNGRTRRDPTTWSYFGIPLRFGFIQRVTDESGHYGVLSELRTGLPEEAKKQRGLAALQRGEGA